MLSRRSLLGGLVALAAPAIVRTPGLLMAVRPSPRWEHRTYQIGYQIVRQEALPLTAEQIAFYEAALRESMAMTRIKLEKVVFRGDMPVAYFLTAEDKWTNVLDAARLTAARLVEV